jgi:hypothetical protein
MRCTRGDRRFFRAALVLRVAVFDFEDADLLALDFVAPDLAEGALDFGVAGGAACGAESESLC